MNDHRASLQGLGVVYFGNDWHAENRTSSHHIATRLAATMPVLYVDSPGMRAPSASGRDLKRALRKLAASLRPPVLVAPNLWHSTVVQLPFRRVPGVELFNRLFTRWAVRRALRHTSIHRRLSWFTVPHPGFMAKRLDEELCVYYCIDDYAAHPGVDAGTIGRRDLELTRAADLVFVAPPALVDGKRAINRHTVYSPHGVDVELFARAAAPDTQIPAAARELAGPVIGFFGSIHDWVDIELIAWLAQQRPDWSYLLVGHVATDVTALRALANVRLAGPQPYPTLPCWAKRFDVAIIPYRLNRQVANANPLKLREYLATGKPIVSVRNPEIEKFAHLVHVTDDRAGFLAALDLCIAGEDPQAPARRMAAVADQTWEHRVNQVLGTVAQSIRQAPVVMPLAEASR